MKHDRLAKEGRSVHTFQFSKSFIHIAKSRKVCLLKNNNHSVQHTITRIFQLRCRLFGPLGVVGPVEYVENEKRQREAETG